MQILNQITDLLWQAAPTFVLVVLLFFFLKSQLFKPLERVFEERAARIEGARRSADAAQSAAQAKARAHQDALKKARVEIYSEQEAARRAALDERAALVRETRNQANETIRAAKERIATEMAAAKAELEAQSQTLAGEIVRVVLEQPGGAPRR
jgi:F0F1-type ATP synthase membrane subunit b/b'